MQSHHYGREYYLDASHPLLGFGHLPLSCYNGHARIMSMDDSSSVYFMADSIREQPVAFVSIINDDKNKGNLTGYYSNTPGYMESYQLRASIAAGSEKNYFSQMKAAAGDELEIKESWIDSLKIKELPLTTHIGFDISSFAANDMVYFNPILWGGYKVNPFSAAERKYPVEMPYPVNETYVFNMEIPDGFVVEEIPKSTRVSYNGQEGFFEYLVQKNETSVQLRSTIVLKKANFEPEEYNALRDFFAYVVKKQGEQIVFRRKKIDQVLRPLYAMELVN